MWSRFCAGSRPFRWFQYPSFMFVIYRHWILTHWCRYCSTVVFMMQHIRQMKQAPSFKLNMFPLLYLEWQNGREEAKWSSVRWKCYWKMLLSWGTKIGLGSKDCKATFYGTEVACALQRTHNRAETDKVFKRTPPQSWGEHRNSTKNIAGGGSAVINVVLLFGVKCLSLTSDSSNSTALISSQYLCRHSVSPRVLSLFLTLVLLEFTFLPSMFPQSWLPSGFSLESYLHKRAAPVFVQLAAVSCWSTEPCPPFLLVRLRHS